MSRYDTGSVYLLAAVSLAVLGALRSGPLLAIFLLILLYACYTDEKEFCVYDCVWWAEIILATVVIMTKGKVPDIRMYFGIVIVILLQETVMSRAYGRADSHAFCACAFMQVALGMGITAHIVQMCISLMLLIAVQSRGKNIDRCGKLKKPVAFIPYITAGFVATMLMR